MKINLILDLNCNKIHTFKLSKLNALRFDRNINLYRLKERSNFIDVGNTNGMFAMSKRVSTIYNDISFIPQFKPEFLFKTLCIFALLLRTCVKKHEIV